jgi:hypothetical protein
MKKVSSIPLRVLATTPRGEVPVGAEDHNRALPSGPGPEATLTYGPYLDSVRRFLLRNSGRQLVAALRSHTGRQVNPEEINGIDIRTEKHGAFYHVVRVDVHLSGRTASLVVNVAATDLSRSTSQREYRLLRHLARHFPYPYLPRVFRRGVVSYRTENEGTRRLQMVVGEWLSYYHEFHLHRREGEGRMGLLLWDSTNGYRYLTHGQTSSLYRQAARILADYYDWNSFRQIYPWHHAAGDFVVREENGEVDLRLITVRDYVPVVGYRTRGRAGKMLALILFFLHLTLQMRLDRLDGVGELVWAEEEFLSHVIRGFLDAMSGKVGTPSPSALYEILSTFAREEWRQVLGECIETYAFSPEELDLVRRYEAIHIEQITQALQTLSWP